MEGGLCKRPGGCGKGVFMATHTHTLFSGSFSQVPTATNWLFLNKQRTPSLHDLQAWPGFAQPVLLGSYKLQEVRKVHNHLIFFFYIFKWGRWVTLCWKVFTLGVGALTYNGLCQVPHVWPYLGCSHWRKTLFFVLHVAPKSKPFSIIRFLLQSYHLYI